MNNNHQQIAILDFGSQYTHLIARRFRQLNVLAKIYPADYDVSKIDNLIGIVLSGGPSSVFNTDLGFNEDVFNANVPILGLCFGHQLMADKFGGEIEQENSREYGRTKVKIKNNILFAGLKKQEMVWMSHGDSVKKLPSGFDIIASSDNCAIAAMAHVKKNFYGLQFHPEVTHTDNGLKILHNFAIDICHGKKDWNIKNVLQESIEKIRQQVGNKKVFLLVSGGVDSTVAYFLLIRAIGKKNIYGLYVDTGLMRKNETREIKSLLSESGLDNLNIIFAEEKYLAALKEIVDPEEKRKICGRLFLDIKDQVQSDLNLNINNWLLGQGTIYPDTIESGGTSNAQVIKTHHNRVNAIEELIKQGKVIEPLKDFYKDEVRELGKLLHLPHKIINRHPFPGPGLAIRVLGSDGLQQISNKELIDLQDKVRSFCSDYVENIQILPLKSVGVQGDNRTYAHAAILQVKEIDWLKLDELSATITNKVKNINRVLITLNKVDKNAKLIKASIEKKRLDILREVDYLVQEEILKAGLQQKIWQFPVVLLPFGTKEGESIVLRPVASLEAMTAKFYPMPIDVLNNIVAKIDKLDIVSNIYFDITNKPPGTIEWE